MTIFFIDVHDGKYFTHDDFGTDFPSPEAARDQAMRTLLDFARGTQPTDEDRAFVATVRDANGDAIYQAKLSFSSTKIS